MLKLYHHTKYLRLLICKQQLRNISYQTYQLSSSITEVRLPPAGPLKRRQASAIEVAIVQTRLLVLQRTYRTAQSRMNDFTYRNYNLLCEICDGKHRGKYHTLTPHFARTAEVAPSL